MLVLSLTAAPMIIRPIARAAPGPGQQASSHQPRGHKLRLRNSTNSTIPHLRRAHRRRKSRSTAPPYCDSDAGIAVSVSRAILCQRRRARRHATRIVAETVVLLFRNEPLSGGLDDTARTGPCLAFCDAGQATILYRCLRGAVEAYCMGQPFPSTCVAARKRPGFRREPTMRMPTRMTRG